MTDPNKTPEEHSSVVGGSTAARRVNCPRSHALEKLVPPDKGNVYAREGTALHEMIAQIIEHDKTPDELLPFTFRRESDGPEGTWEFTVDDVLWYDIGQPALDAFDTFLEEIERETGGVFDYVVEERCAMPGIDDAFGTSDVVWTCGDYSGVWDWKFGRNPVKADKNMQLMFYARAAASAFPHLFGSINGVEGNDRASKFEEIDPTREVILSIMQPKVSDEPDEYIVTVAELEEFRVKLIAAVHEAEEKGAEARVAKGKWCDYATCKAVCPLWAGQSASFGEKMARLGKAMEDARYDDKEDPELGAVADAEAHFMSVLPELLDLADVTEGWIKEVRRAALTALENDADVEGWRLGVSTTSRRAWAVSTEELKKFFKNRRYKLDDYMPRTLLTMPQAEKMLKKDERTIPDDMITKNVSEKIALVREDSSLPAPEMSSERAKVLGDKLAQLGGTAKADN